MSSLTEDHTQDSSLPSSALNTPPTTPSLVGVHGEGVLSTESPTDVPPPRQRTLREEVLSNRDILTLIFETFLPSTTGPADQKARGLLHALALLCRSFSGPALDCFWKDLDSLIPHVNLLEPLVFVENGVYLSRSSQLTQI